MWNKTVGMGVELEERGEPKIQTDHQGDLGPIDWSQYKRRATRGPYVTIRWKAIRHHQNQDWEKTVRRRMNDVSKRTRPALKR